MKTDLVQILYALFLLVPLAAVQDIWPVFGGTKPALVLFGALHLAALSEPEPDSHGHLALVPHTYALFTALLAGGLLEALGPLPTGCATSFLLLAIFGIRLLHLFYGMAASRLTRILLGAAGAGLLEIWYYLWGMRASDESLLVRLVAAALITLPAGALLTYCLPAIERHIGLRGDAR